MRRKRDVTALLLLLSHGGLTSGDIGKALRWRTRRVHRHLVDLKAAEQMTGTVEGGRFVWRLTTDGWLELAGADRGGYG